MIYKTLISPQMVANHLSDNHFVFVDCGFSLADTFAGERAYLAGHVPGAVYAHLDNDLSGPPVTDNGRHPLPTPEALIDLFSRLGIDESKQVVAYDNVNGMIASRLWWMLRYMGHTAVSVMEGGWQAWEREGFPVNNGAEENKLASFHGTPRTDWLVTIDDVEQVSLLIDSRAADRYQGENETRDARAGHIPGAVNFFFGKNIDSKQAFLPEAALKAQFQQLLGDTPAEQAVFYCGSGVSACVSLLAMNHVGMGNGRLYVGSWSEWSRDNDRPIKTGQLP